MFAIILIKGLEENPNLEVFLPVKIYTHKLVQLCNRQQVKFEHIILNLRLLQLILLNKWCMYLFVTHPVKKSNSFSQNNILILFLP